MLLHTCINQSWRAEIVFYDVGSVTHEADLMARAALQVT
jgi:hypothetical protein